jgi:hypothetical protein
MIRPNRTPQRLIALFALGALLLMPPMLAVFSQPVRILGIPALYLYLFVAWAALIGMTAAIVRRIDTAQGTDRAPPDPVASDGPNDA